MRISRSQRLPLRRHRRRPAAAITLLIAAALASPSASADAPTPGDGCDWTSFRNGSRNHGATACEAVGPTNVSTLTPRLLYRTRDSVTSTPAVVEGMLYVGAWDGRFYAFDTDAAPIGVGDPSLGAVQTVAPVWEFEVDDANGVSFGRIVSSPSVADVAGTRVVLFAGGATLYALDGADGALLAQVCLDPRAGADRCQGSGDREIEVSASPVVVPAGPGAVGVVIGLDVHNAAGVGRTGVVKLELRRDGDRWSFAPRWKFDPEGPVVYTGDGLLTEGSGTGGGCGGVWGTPAVDAELDLVVLGTASCSGRSAAWAGAAEKLFGISYSTGALVWRFDPPRPFGTDMDDDFGASPQVFDVDGRTLAGAGGKDGWYYAVDARTGAPVWSTQMGQAGHLSRGFAIGGVLGSPAVGAVAGRPALFVTTAISTPFGAPLDEGSPESLDASLLEDPARMLSLHALDAGTGAVLWRQPLTRQTYGHPTYANGVVLVPATAGLSVQAFHADTGVPLWTSPPLNGAPSSGVAVTDDGVYIGVGTRQTDAGFKVFGDDAVVPEEVQALVPRQVADVTGADPQERAAGIWGFRVAG